MINGGIPAGNLTGGIVVAVHPNVLFVKRHEVPAVSADGQAGMGADKAVDGDGTLTSGGDGIDGKFGAGVYVAAHKNVGLRGLVGQAVGLGPISSAQFHLGALQQAAPLDALTDGQEDPVAGNGFGVGFVIGGTKAPAFVPDGDAALEDDAGDFAVFRKDFFGAPAAVQADTFLGGLSDFFLGGGHLFPRLQAEHGDAVRAAAVDKI